MILKKITEYIFPVFTASLVISYFACYGYYSRFSVDITSYIGVSDLTVIFAKYVWLAIIALAIIIYLPYTYFSRPAKYTWWDKTIGKSVVKRRAFLIFPVLIAVIIAAIFSRKILNFVAVAYFIGLFLLLITASILTVVAAFSDKKDITEVPVRDWVSVVAVSTFIIFLIPYIVGYIMATYGTQGRIVVKFENVKESLTTDGTNDIYIGKTSDYFFVYHPKTKTSTAYHMDKVESFEFLPTK